MKLREEFEQIKQKNKTEFKEFGLNSKIRMKEIEAQSALQAVFALVIMLSIAVFTWVVFRNVFTLWIMGVASILVVPAVFVILYSFYAAITELAKLKKEKESL